MKKIKTFGLYDKRYTWGKPLFKLGKPKKVKKVDKKLSYKKAKKKYLLKPFGDADKDGYFNVNDCKPLDPKKHGVFKKHAKKTVFFYDTKGYGVKPGEVTQEMIFKNIEKKLPKTYGGEKGQEGGTYSKRLTNSLLEMEKGEIPTLKKVVGVHELEKPGSVSDDTVFAHHHLQNYLKSSYPEKKFNFDIYNPSEVSYIDEKGRKKTEKITKLLTKPMKSVSADVRIPIHLQKKSRKTKNIIPEIERMTGMKLTEEQKKQIEKRLVTEEDISGISSSYNIKPHWSIEELPKHFASRKDIKVHISDDPVEVIMKSMYGGMSSCESITGGICSMGPFSDVRHRHPVAYFYLTGREPYRDKPSARVMMRRGHPVDTRGRLDLSKEYIGVEPTIYGGGSGREWYPFLLQEFLKKKKLFHIPIKTKKAHKGYSDWVAHNPRKAFQYLEDEWLEKMEREGYDDYDPEEVVVDNVVDFSHRIPSVYGSEIKKPSSSGEKPTFRDAELKLVSRDKKIPRSFFHNLLHSKSSDIRYKALGRPQMETKRQEENVKRIKDQLKDEDLTEQQKDVLKKRLRKEEKELKSIKEIEPEPFHMMSFDPSKQIRMRVASYPRLKQETIKSLLPSKEYDITSRLFYNPALDYKQRKTIAKREGDLMYDPHGIKAETEPRVAKESFKVTEKIRPQGVAHIVNTTSNEALIGYIYNKYPEHRHDLIRNNPHVPKYIIEQYITDLSHSKMSKENKIRKIHYLIMNTGHIDTNIAKKIYRMFGNNPEIANSLYFNSAITPSSIKRKIQSRMFKKGYEDLLSNLINNPRIARPETVELMIKKLPRSQLNNLLRNINLNNYAPPFRESIFNKLVSKAKSSSSTKEAFIRMLENSRSVDIEKLLLKSTDKYSNALHRDVIRYLMQSHNKSVTDELMKRYA